MELTLFCLSGRDSLANIPKSIGQEVQFSVFWVGWFLLGIMEDVERKTRKHPFYSTWFPATALYKKALSLSTEFFGTMLYIEGDIDYSQTLLKQTLKGQIQVPVTVLWVWHCMCTLDKARGQGGWILAKYIFWHFYGLRLYNNLI